MYKYILKPVFFLFPPESIHHFVFRFLKIACAISGVPGFLKFLYRANDKRLERTVFGIKFPNPVGLAAGFDKDAELFDELGCLGFGFIEVGTVTPLPQEGNNKPRMFRLPEDEALINRMGFNNKGAEATAVRVKNRKPGIVIGGNIGKNKNTANENAIADYEKCFRALHDYVDFFVVNVSSPNTPDLRQLQEKEPLKALLSTLKLVNKEYSKPKPILLKIAPDISNAQLDDIIGIVMELKIDGVVATNTTVGRTHLESSKEKIEQAGAGGLSGKPLSVRSTEVIRYLSEKSGKAFPIIGVGGIHSPEDAIEKLEAGASLVQLYTGFIYEGPSLAKKINKAILEKYHGKKN